MSGVGCHEPGTCHLAASSAFSAAAAAAALVATLRRDCSAEAAGVASRSVDPATSVRRADAFVALAAVSSERRAMTKAPRRLIEPLVWLTATVAADAAARITCCACLALCMAVLICWRGCAVVARVVTVWQSQWDGGRANGSGHEDAVFSLFSFRPRRPRTLGQSPAMRIQREGSTAAQGSGVEAADTSAGVRVRGAAL